MVTASSSLYGVTAGFGCKFGGSETLSGLWSLSVTMAHFKSILTVNLVGKTTV